MKNVIVEQEGNAYIVESAEGDTLHARQYVFDTKTEKFTKLDEKEITGDYVVISPEIVRVKHKQEVKASGKTQQRNTKRQASQKEQKE
ncbi:hypothetical protein [Salibacterium lacus]|uniref:DUF3006 domain-containing protein n=1 Tax=Salibacterium lacus TaxID=1898109 RepID=A0ABW5SYI3_9BACI